MFPVVETLFLVGKIILEFTTGLFSEKDSAVEICVELSDSPG